MYIVDIHYGKDTLKSTIKSILFQEIGLKCISCDINITLNEDDI
jgi:hypothetical protein